MNKAAIFWFTGLSGSGKTTIAECAKIQFASVGKKVKIFDGDTIRSKLNRHLGFTPPDIKENNRIIIDLCLQERKTWDFIFVPIISPFQESRLLARKRLSPDFYLIYIRSSLATVMRRDPKGLYQKARFGEIDFFIGVDERVPYQPPRDFDLVLDTERNGPDSSVKQFCRFVIDKNRQKNEPAGNRGWGS